jgi:transcription antitermination factor NusG
MSLTQIGVSFTCDSEEGRVTSACQFSEPVLADPIVVAACDSPQWYAIHTRARHEKMVISRLENLAISTFLPITTEVRHWSDRRKLVEVPLFSCYAFVKIRRVPEVQAKIAHTDGVLGFVGSCGGPVPIPDVEIANIRTLLSGVVPYSPYPFLKIGQRVRVRGGSLDGIEGFLMARNGNDTLVISVEPIQRSLAINVNGYTVEPA